MSDERDREGDEDTGNGKLLRRSDTERHRVTGMTPLGKVVTWQSAMMVFGIVGSVVGAMYAFDRRIEERAAVAAVEVRRLADNAVDRREFEQVRAASELARERVDGIAEQLAAIRAILDERLPPRRRQE